MLIKTVRVKLVLRHDLNIELVCHIIKLRKHGFLHQHVDLAVFPHFLNIPVSFNDSQLAVRCIHDFLQFLAKIVFQNLKLVNLINNPGEIHLNVNKYLIYLILWIILADRRSSK